LADPLLNPVFATRYNGNTPSAVPFNDFHTEQTTKSQAVFAQGTFHVTDDLRATAGARYTSDEKDMVQSWRINISPSGCDNLKQDEKWSEATWKVGADYDVTEDVLLYGSVSRGFKAGGFNGGSCGNEYDPEELLAYEVGLKTVFADRRVQLNLAGFYYDYDDYQARLFIGGSARIENAVKATVQGAEAEFLIRPFGGFEIDGSVSWLDGEFDQYLSDNPMTPATTLIDLKGNQLLRSPEWSYNVGAQYTFELSEFGSLTARYELASKDDYYISIFNDDFTVVDSYTIQNFRLIWSDGRKWQVQAFVENLSDEEYLEALLISPSVGGALGMWALPRTWGVQLSFGAF
jgi:iron complex outermembrane receptor protein